MTDSPRFNGLIFDEKLGRIRVDAVAVSMITDNCKIQEKAVDINLILEI